MRRKKTNYRNNPQWQIALDFKNKLPNIPIICDPSHICGNREGLFDVSQQAFNFEYNGLMIETHCNPDEAWSDAAQQVTPARLKEILVDLELRQSDDPDSIYKAGIDNLRHQIDELDTSILDTVAQRMKVANAIGNLKKEHNVAVFQPERWKQIKENSVKAGASLGLLEDFIDKLLQAIHQESVAQQNRIMVKKEEKI